MTQQEWFEKDWLKKLPASSQEIGRLLGIVKRNLADSQQPGLSTDGRHNFAYTATLQAATAALRASGYRVDSAKGHHHYTLQTLLYTIEADQALVVKLDAFRKKRNAAEYDMAGSISEAEAADMIETAKHLADDVLKWLRDKHPLLLADIDD